MYISRKVSEMENILHMELHFCIKGGYNEISSSIMRSYLETFTTHLKKFSLSGRFKLYRIIWLGIFSRNDSRSWSLRMIARNNTRNNTRSRG